MKKKCGKKSLIWLLVIVLLVCVAAVGLLYKTVGGNDRLTVYDSVTFLTDGRIIQRKEEGEICITEFEASLGNKVKSGLLYVELWNNGICEQSVPALVTQDLEDLYLHMPADMDYREVVISTNEFGGVWTTYFAIPYNETVTDWSFTSHAEGEEIRAQAGEESILGALRYDNGREIVARIVWSKEKVEKIPEERNRFPMKMFRLEGLVEVDDPMRKAVYLSALEQLIYQKVMPDGDKWLDGIYEFAVFDIDGDGVDELIIQPNWGYMRVYDYDEETKGLRIESMPEGAEEKSIPYQFLPDIRLPAPG